MLLHQVCNMGKSGNSSSLLRTGSILEGKLPEKWIVEAVGIGPLGATQDAILRIAAPDGKIVDVEIEFKESLQPALAMRLGEELKQRSAGTKSMVVAPFLSPSCREKLKKLGLNYLDFTGNVRISLDAPGLYIEAEGADKNPVSSERNARTLKGSKAGRIARELVDFTSVPGVRELASKSGIDPGYISRVFALLEAEALIRDRAPSNSSESNRVGSRRGRRVVDWQALLRRWAVDAPLEKRTTSIMCIDPRGAKATLCRLADWSDQYAVTGSFAAAEISPSAPARLLQVYVQNAQTALETLGLRQVESGANVMLMEPESPLPFLRSKVVGGTSYVAISQMAADLMSSPGRGPAEAEELIDWMTKNEEKWRG